MMILPLLLPPPLPLLQLEEDFVRANPEWVKELEIMVATKVCVFRVFRVCMCVCVCSGCGEWVGGGCGGVVVGGCPRVWGRAVQLRWRAPGIPPEHCCCWRRLPARRSRRRSRR